MSVVAQTIHDRILSELDAEGSDRYTFAQDTKHAINSAIDILVSLFNEAFAENKLTPESLRELNFTKVWQANSYSRVAFNSSEVGHSMWSLIAVYPKPKVNKATVVIPNTKSNSVSKFLPAVSFVSGRSAKRLSQEEWGDNEKNAFMAGNSILAGDLVEYGYQDFSDYSSTSYPSSTDKKEITIRPDIPNSLVAISYLKYPNRVVTLSDSIEFPESLTELLVEIALNKISVKQNNGTNLYGVTAQNVSRLASLMR